MKRILCFLLFFSIQAFAVEEAGDNAKLARYLSLLSTLKPGSSYEDVKNQVPEIGELQLEPGNDQIPKGTNGQAHVEVVLFNVPLKGEFNFHKGGLISHGFRASKLSAGDAHSLLTKSVQRLEILNGASTRTIRMPDDPEGDCPTTAVFTNFDYEKNGITFGLHFRFDPDNFSLSWGAQTAGPKR